MADQAEFIGRLMFDFNREIDRYLREELGCRQLINAGNWRTADQVILDDVERWSYTANEVVGKNHYFAALHKGVNAGWQFLPGQTFTSKSFPMDPTNSPLSVRQVVGHPFIISESLWVPPNQYEAEAPLIVAAQSSLTGLDTFFWFAPGVEEWQQPGSKWTFSVPMTLGQFPAAALIFRNGYIRRAPPWSMRNAVSRMSGSGKHRSLSSRGPGIPTVTWVRCRQAPRSKKLLIL